MKRGKRVLGAGVLVLIVAAMTAIFVSCEKKPLPPPPDGKLTYDFESMAELKKYLPANMVLPYNDTVRAITGTTYQPIVEGQFVNSAEWKDTIDGNTVSVKLDFLVSNIVPAENFEVGKDYMYRKDNVYYYFYNYTWEYVLGEEEPQTYHSIEYIEVLAPDVEPGAIYNYFKSFS